MTLPDPMPRRVNAYMCDDLLQCVEGHVGHISLNRPRAIHALTHAMVTAMLDVLWQWRDDPSVRLVLLDHAVAQDAEPKLSRGFCAGGDIAMLRASALEDDGARAKAFFFDEYRLNHLIFIYPKPVVAFMDGIVMGGGVGISAPARYRVVTESTRFAMPETGIGLFPDVGGGWHLSRLPGRTGAFLALTGARLDGAECMALGLASHYLPKDSLVEAKARMVAGEAPEAVLDSLATTPPEARILANRDRIDTHFASDHLEDILASLAASDDPWAAKEWATLSTKSPLSCKVALRQLAASADLMDFADNMAMEYRIGARMILQSDFAEGVRALIVDKTGDPKWSPATPEGVTDAMLDAIFAPLPNDQEWTPL